MNAMNITVYNGLQWYAVRMVAPGNGHRRTAKMGGEYETYKSRSGHIKKRRVAGTGSRVFVPEHILRRAGFEVFLPVKQQWKRKNRYAPDEELVSYPLMVDWLFVGWPASECRWAKLMSLNVVIGVLGSGGKPIRVGSDRISKLMSAWGGGVRAKRKRSVRIAQSFSVGDVPTIVAGPFEGFSGKVLEVEAVSAKLMINIFGRSTPVSVPVGKLELDRTENPELPIDGYPTGGNAPCMRCSGTMVPTFNRARRHHVSCRDCKSVGALNSASPAAALERWNSPDCSDDELS
jgi:transcription termination/antitermination protein NusG